MTTFSPLPEKKAEPYSVSSLTPFAAAQAALALAPAPPVVPKDTGACASNLPPAPAPAPLPSMKLVKDISVKPPPQRIKGKKKRPPMPVPRRSDETKRALADTLSYSALSRQELPERAAAAAAAEGDLLSDTPEPKEGFEKMHASVNMVMQRLDAEMGGELDRSWTTIGRWIEAYYSDVLVQRTTQVCETLHSLGTGVDGSLRLGYSMTILEQVLMLMIRTAPALKPILRTVYRDVIEAVFVDHVDPPFFFLESTPAIVEQLLTGALPPPHGTDASPRRQRPSDNTLAALRSWGTSRIEDAGGDADGTFITDGDAMWGRCDAPQHVPSPPPQDSAAATLRPEVISPVSALKQQIRTDVYAMYPLTKPRGEWRRGMTRRGKSPPRRHASPDKATSPRTAFSPPKTVDTTGPVVGGQNRHGEAVAGSPAPPHDAPPAETVAARVQKRFEASAIYRDHVAAERKVVKDVRLKAMRRARAVKNVSQRVMDKAMAGFMRCVLLAWRRAAQSLRRQCGHVVELPPEEQLVPTKPRLSKTSTRGSLPSVATSRCASDEPLPTPAPAEYKYVCHDESDVKVDDFLANDDMSFDDLHDKTRAALKKTRGELADALAREAELEDMVAMLRKDLTGLHSKYATERDLAASQENTIQKLRTEISVLNENVHQLTRFSTRYKDLHTALDQEHNLLKLDYLDLANAAHALGTHLVSADEGTPTPHAEQPADLRDSEWGTCGIATAPSPRTTAADLLEWLNVQNFGKMSCREATSWDQGPHLIQPLAQILNAICPEKSGVSAQVLQEMNNQECFIKKSDMLISALARIGISVPAAPEDLAAPASTFPASSTIYQGIAASMVLRLGGGAAGRCVAGGELPAPLDWDAYKRYDQPPPLEEVKEELQTRWKQAARWGFAAVGGMVGTLHDATKKLIELRGDGGAKKDRFEPFADEELPDVERSDADLEEVNARFIENAEELFKIFAYYANGTGGSGGMEEAEFMKFALDTKLLGKTLSHAQAVNVFKNAPKAAEASMAAREWMAAIPHLAVLKFKSPAMSLGEKVTQLLTNNVLQYSRQLETEQFRKMIYSEKVQAVLRDASGLTLAVFKQYSEQNNRPGTSFAPSYMTKAGFVTFIKDASIQDQTCTAYILDEIFRQIQDPEDDSDDLIYQEFCECLVAIAAVKRPEPYLPLSQRCKDFLDTWVLPLVRRKDKLPQVSGRKGRRSLA